MEEVPSDSVFNYFRAKVQTTRKSKEDKEHVVAEEEMKHDPAPEEMLNEEEVKQDPAPEEMLNEEEVKHDPAAEEVLKEEEEQETAGAL